MRRHYLDSSPLGPRRPSPPGSTTSGRTAAGNQEGNHSNWVLTRPREAGWVQRPFIKAGHLLHKVGPA